MAISFGRKQRIVSNKKRRHTIQITNDRPLYNLPLVNYNVYWPTLFPLGVQNTKRDEQTLTPTIEKKESTNGKKEYAMENVIPECASYRNERILVCQLLDRSSGSSRINSLLSISIPTHTTNLKQVAKVFNLENSSTTSQNILMI